MAGRACGPFSPTACEKPERTAESTQDQLNPNPRAFARGGVQFDRRGNRLHGRRLVEYVDEHGPHPSGCMGVGST